ncbi:hypothetical protein GOODEAATRI_031992 [Goodea atripinnis]|uniref:Uncharacterized protein n=1 Tax=Goodea atripinnis TaxID=208336 RepID=A0ABV0PIQ4_9TELE
MQRIQSEKNILDELDSPLEGSLPYVAALFCGRKGSQLWHGTDQDIAIGRAQINLLGLAVGEEPQHRLS